uniref:Uncharacterized protein n=1 Tax=Manihot esculenta TaxID=3983 RepID=A0A2C9UHI5_MANES
MLLRLRFADQISLFNDVVASTLALNHLFSGTILFSEYSLLDQNETAALGVGTLFSTFLFIMAMIFFSYLFRS